MTIYTVGHSVHTIDLFLQLLKKSGVDTVADVRSSPYSAYSPQFNRETLKNALEKNGLKYIFLGVELGARHENPLVLGPGGKVDFEKVRKLETFKNGIKRLKDGAQKGFKIAVMCSEKNPVECHRFSLVTYALKKEGLAVKHILATGELLGNEDLEKSLLPPVPDMFGDAGLEIESVYKKIAEKTAFMGKI